VEHSTGFDAVSIYSLVRVRGALSDVLRLAAMSPRVERETEPAPPSEPAPVSTPVPEVLRWTVPALRKTTPAP